VQVIVTTFFFELQILLKALDSTSCTQKANKKITRGYYTTKQQPTKQKAAAKKTTRPKQKQTAALYQ
jgi:hypothetical protein